MCGCPPNAPRLRSTPIIYAAGGPSGPTLRQRSDPAKDPVVKLTGERPMEGATPDSLLALHDAGYREVIARLG